MNTIKRSGSVLLRLLPSNSRHASSYKHNFWTCGSCATSVYISATRAVHSCACSYSRERGQGFKRSECGVHDVEVNPSKGRSKIVLRNWDKHYDEARRRKKTKEETGKDQGEYSRLKSTTTRWAEESVEKEDLAQQRPRSKTVDPSDEFGSLTIGNTNVPVDDVHTKMTKEQLSELESNIYSIDQAEEGDDVRIVPEDLSDRTNFRQLKIKTKALLRGGRLTEALDLFTHAMKVGGLRYDMQDLSHTYTVLIAECGRMGHVKMALKLFKEMKDRSCFVQPSVYTSLFNAFANSVGDREKNIERLEKIRRSMLDKGYIPNVIHYHTLIKAHGRLGQVQAAFSVVDEMIQKSISAEPNARRPKLTTETFNFLLSACINDKENGFRHSLATWKKMIDMRIAPDHFTFKLFLRSIRECGIVVPKSVRKLLGEMNPYVHNFQLDESKSAYLVPGTQVEIHDLKVVPPMIHSEAGFDDNCATILTDLVNEENDTLVTRKSHAPDAHLNLGSGGSELLNLLRNNSTPSKGVQTLLQYPHNRLAILGGLKAIVAEMESFKVKPDLKMVTELMQIIHPLDTHDLMLFVNKHNVKPDTDFYNMMIKRYIVWDREKDARSVLKLMHQSRLHPNVMTWGIFSLACKDWKSGKQLLKDIDSYQMEPNIQTMGGLLGTAVRNFDPRYVLRVMEELNIRKLQPDAIFVEKVTNFRAAVQKGLVSWEQGLEVTPFALQTQLKDNYEHFMNYYTKFKIRYHTWMNTVPEKVLAQARNPEDVADPWEEDFRTRMNSLKTAQQN